MIVLGIESSCDETGVAIYDSSRNLLVHRLHSQIPIHAKYGGVVPEIASRDHIKRVLPLVREVLIKSGFKLEDIDAVAYTAGPGLVGALLVGAAFAKALSFALQIPAIPVHHMEAHLLVPLLEDNSVDFPFLALLVSGGHTQLIEAKTFGEYNIMGESIDDAAGEAFDKVAKILGLPYPGGPELEKLAKKGRKGVFTFPRPMIHKGLNFSFSGLKTYALNCFRNSDGSDQTKADIALAFQEAVLDTLVIKSKNALKDSGLKNLVVAGGVTSNKSLREKLNNMGEEEGVSLHYPGLEFCTDNGAMIAYAGWCHFVQGKQDDMEINVYPRWEMGNNF